MRTKYGNFNFYVSNHFLSATWRRPISGFLILVQFLFPSRLLTLCSLRIYCPIQWFILVVWINIKNGRGHLLFFYLGWLGINDTLPLVLSISITDENFTLAIWWVIVLIFWIMIYWLSLASCRHAKVYFPLIFVILLSAAHVLQFITTIINTPTLQKWLVPFLPFHFIISRYYY